MSVGSNIIAPGSTRKGGSFGPCPQFNGSSALPWKQSSGIFPDDPDAVDMVNVDEAYDADAADVVKLLENGADKNSKNKDGPTALPAG